MRRFASCSDCSCAIAMQPALASRRATDRGGTPVQAGGGNSGGTGLRDGCCPGGRRGYRTVPADCSAMGALFRVKFWYALSEMVGAAEAKPRERDSRQRAYIARANELDASDGASSSTFGRRPDRSKSIGHRNGVDASLRHEAGTRPWRSAREALGVASLLLLALSGCPATRDHAIHVDGAVDSPEVDRASSGSAGGPGGTGTGGSTASSGTGGAGAGAIGGGTGASLGTGGAVTSAGTGGNGAGTGGLGGVGSGGAGGGLCSPPCGTGKACTDGLCCNIDQANCDGTCSDVASDDRNCGICGRHCGSNERCQNAGCRLVDGQPCAVGSDCVSGICTMFFRDADGDTWGTTQTSGRCTITEAPAGYATRSGDCCDVAPDEPTRVISAKIHPGAGFQVDSAGGVCGITWDYDCSGHVESDSQKVVGCVSSAPPCLDRMGDVDPSLCGKNYFECDACVLAGTPPPDPPACVFSPNGAPSCIDSGGRVWECR